MNKQEITSKIKEITETGAVCGVDVYVCLKGEEQGFYIEKMISMNSLKDRIRSIALEIINTQYLQDEVVYCDILDVIDNKKAVYVLEQSDEYKPFALLNEAYNYACELEVLDAMIVKKWCKSGVFEEKGFTRSKKSLRDLQKEIDELINKYENDKENLDLLEQLQTYDYEVEDLLKNIGAFLYEMACEDSPFGDHTELYHKTVEREWKYN